MKKNMINYCIDIAILISFIAVFLTGVIKWPGLIEYFGISYDALPMLFLSNLHDWSGLLMSLLSVAHVVLHFDWIIAMTKKIIRGGKMKTDVSENKKNTVKIQSFVKSFVLLISAAELLFATGSFASQNTDGQDIQNYTETGVSVAAAGSDSKKKTCPRGRSCTSPVCGLWTDSDKNGMCDRGF